MKNKNIIKDNGVWELFASHPTVIAGPCSVETEESFLKSVQEIKDSGIAHILRGGIWKPRTKPGCFEGVGEIGLKWMRNAKEKYGIPISTEVACEKHVYIALKYGMDMLWIGARTTANPFAVQEIAEALAGVEIPVFIKNPVNPDVDLWEGAVERLGKSGLTKIGLIHRGFSSYEKSSLRNQPQWQIPLEMKRRFPELPMICDPSHICGNRTDLAGISQKAMDLGYNGLMIESHHDPDKAWSDARQQITAVELRQLLDSLVIRQNRSLGTELEDLRNQIDLFDDQLLNIIAERMNVAKAIGMYKKQNNIIPLQTSRWDEVLDHVVANGRKKGLSDSLVNEIYRLLHQESINKQLEILNQK